MARAAKRADYFEAGTLVVWDVDPIADTILKYRFDAPDRPEVFVRGQAADAEPAVPNWTITVDVIFA
jgi:Uma2 family endonuclease